jgi:anaerobic selenocysteine-containing dehydrogenase
MRIVLELKRDKLAREKTLMSRIRLILLVLYGWATDPAFKYIITPTRRFVQRVVTVFRWLPVTFYDSQWDYCWIYNILHRKLTLMEKFFRSPRAMSGSAEEDADDIHQCIEILERLMENDYAKDEFESYYAKWGEPNFRTVPIPNEKNFFRLNIDYPKEKTEEDSGKRIKEFDGLIGAEEDMRKQDIIDLFTKLQERIEFWWD